MLNNGYLRNNNILNQLQQCTGYKKTSFFSLPIHLDLVGNFFGLIILRTYIDTGYYGYRYGGGGGRQQQWEKAWQNYPRNMTNR